MSPSSILNVFLVDTQSVGRLNLEDWSLLFAEARSCGLMSRVAYKVEPTVPHRFRQLVRSAMLQSTSLEGDVHRELRFIEAAIGTAKTRVILLKGAAYLSAGLPAARGRIFSDIDILVDRNDLSKTEGSLMLAGWIGHKIPPYDQRYYREWSHELPPMTHVQRGTTIDLHHTIAMPTCRIRIDGQRMLDEAVEIPGEGHWWRLKDEDLVLHAASHLLLNSEFDRGLRDLWDIDILVRHFSRDAPNFVERVVDRANEVGLNEIVRDAFTLCHHFLRTPLPHRLKPSSGIVITLLKVAASTRHPDTRPVFQDIADTLLLFRELTLRLPPALLARHLWHKTVVALTPQAHQSN